MVVGVEVLSHFLDWKDRNTCVLFGDGAGDPLNTSYPIITGHQMAEELEKAANEPQPEPGPQENEGGQQGSEDTEPVVTDDVQELARLANEAYEKAQEALKQGNLVLYAQCVEEMARYVQQMVR